MRRLYSRNPNTQAAPRTINPPLKSSTQKSGLRGEVTRAVVGVGVAWALEGVSAEAGVDEVCAVSNTG